MINTEKPSHIFSHFLTYSMIGQKELTGTNIALKCCRRKKSEIQRLKAKKALNIVLLVHSL